MLGAELRRLREDVLVLAESKLGCESLLGAVEPKILESAGFGNSKVGVRDVDQGGAPPESERSTQNRHREPGVTGRPRLATLPEKLLEAHTVERARSDLGAIAGGNGLDRRSAELAPKM